MQKQTEFFTSTWRHRLSHGGELRKNRLGRGARPLSNKLQLHVVFKTNSKALPRGLRHPKTYTLVNGVIRQYAQRFFVKVESIAVARDHIHLAIRCGKRSFLQSFLRSSLVKSAASDRYLPALL